MTTGLGVVLGANIRALMEERGITQMQLAKATSGVVSQKTISNVLNGVPIKSNKLEAIAKVLRVEPWQLLLGPGDPKQKLVDVYSALDQRGREFVQEIIEREKILAEQRRADQA